MGNPLFMVMITPHAPALPPWGAGAHCDAFVLPVQDIPNNCEQVIRHSRNRGMSWRRGRRPQERYDYYHVISHEKHEMMMGADALIPPVLMNGRRPEGRHATASPPFFSETELAPPYPVRGLRRGALIHFQ